MKELESIEQGAETLIQYRNTFASSLEGILAAFFDGDNAISPIAVNEAHDRVGMAVQDYLTRLNDISGIASKVVLSAYNSLSEDDELSLGSYDDFLRETSAGELSELYATRLRESLERDAMEAMKEASFTVKQVSLKAGMHAAQTGHNDRSAMIKVTEQLRRYRDRRGRMMSAELFVKLTARDALLTLRNDVYVAGLAKAGIQRAFVKHADPKHRTHGTAMTLESYEEVRGKIFHPRASSVVALYINAD